MGTITPEERETTNAHTIEIENPKKTVGGCNKTNATQFRIDPPIGALVGGHGRMPNGRVDVGGWRLPTHRRKSRRDTQAKKAVM